MLLFQWFHQKVHVSGNKLCRDVYMWTWAIILTRELLPMFNELIDFVMKQSKIDFNKCPYIPRCTQEKINWIEISGIVQSHRWNFHLFKF